MVATIGSLFSGIGGFDLAFRNVGAETRWLCEIDRDCQKVLAKRFPGVPIHDDVREVGTHNLEPVNVITFGSPCQDMSVAGTRGGLAGSRSALFYEATRIIRDIRPEFAIWENVPGALSSNSGRDFASILDELAESGAMDIAWRVLDAQWFGVAQRRRRVFVVADFRGERASEILAVPEGGPWDSAPSRETGEESTEDALAGAQVTGTLTSNGDQRKGFRNGDGLVAHTLTACHRSSEDGSGRGIPLIPVIARTLTANNQRMDGGTETFVPARGAVRRLTPIECERLQGFPDDWTLGSDSARYRMLGNAVCVPVVQWIAKRMQEVA